MCPYLVQISIQGDTCLGIIRFDVGLCEHCPPHEIPGLDCLDPCGLDQIPIHYVYPLDGLLGWW